MRYHREYPERTRPLTASIYLEYMERESVRWGRSVRTWVEAYLRRNKIP